MCGIPETGPFTRQSARARGLSDDAIDYRLRVGRWRSGHQGVLIGAQDPPEGKDHLRAALLTQPRGAAWLSHTTAAALWGLDVQPAAAEPVHLVVPRTAQGRQRTGIVLHRAALADDERTECSELPVTSAARTVVDVARSLPRVDAVVAADSALRQGLCNKEALLVVLDRMAGLRNVIAARRVVDDCDPGSDSAPETIFRLTLVDGGLPRPVANFALVDAWGRIIARGDLVYDKWLIWLEYDGYDVHSRRAAFRADRVRRRMLERRGWLVKQFSDVDLRLPVGLVREVDRLITDAPKRIAALDPALSPEVARAQQLLGITRQP